MRLLNLLKPTSRTPIENTWVCRHSSLGKPCRDGPDRRGRCGASYHCNPSHVGGGWICNRPTLNGGPCQPGPQPDGTCCNPQPACRPARAIQAKHNALASWVGLCTLGLIIVVVGYAADNNFALPGPVSTVHSSLKKCSSCHANIDDGRFGWLHALAQYATPEKDSGTCLTCHMMAPGSLKPHGLALKTLTAKTAPTQSSSKKLKASLVSRINDILPDDTRRTDNVFCATCHKEHRDGKAGLNMVDSAGCHTCHQTKFDSFAKNHPEFSNYPFTRRLRIKIQSHVAFRDPLSGNSKEATGRQDDPAGMCELSYTDSRSATHDGCTVRDKLRFLPSSANKGN